MNTRFLLLALVLAVPFIALAQGANPKKMVAEKEVKTLARQRFAAQVSKDYAFLEKAFSNDLIYIHGDGHQQNKAEYIQSIRNGKSQYGKIDVEMLNARVYNDERTAVVNGTILITSAPQARWQH